MKNQKEAIKRGESLFIIVNLVVALFAFSFLINEMSLVSSLTPAEAKAIGEAGYSLEDVGLGGATGPSTITQPVGGGLLNTIFGPDIMAGTSGHIITTAAYAAGAYLVGQLVGGMIGLDDDQTNALSVSLALGAGTWQGLVQFTETFAAGTGGATTAFWIGIGVAIAAFIILYKSTDTQIVTFKCESWQAPVGGADCQKCNEGDEPCSEYRCKSLGQACQLLNAGTEQEKCTWVNPKDVKSPGISPWEQVLTAGYSYKDVRIRPPGDGSEPGRMTIVRDGATNGCVKAFTPLEFGIATIGPDGDTEPAQCKIDYNHTSGFENMSFYFGDSNLYLYNHTQKLSLPSPATINAVAPELKHDGTYTLYARCRDANGNENKDEFAIRFCVDAGPDTTPPEIKNTNIANNMPIKYNQTSLDLEVYVNEPSDCKWSHEDRTYDNMENSMACANNFWEMNNELVYTCKTTLTGLKDHQENKFYFRCKDQPILGNSSDRNVNQQGYKYTVIGTQTLNIIDIKPNGTIYDSTDVVPVFLEVETANGYKNGEAICYYSTTGNENDYIAFLYEPNEPTNLHKQRQDLPEGNYKYYIKCVDLGGNRDDVVVEFKVDVDRDTPAIARAYKSNDLLKIVTTENSTCTYSNKDCNFNIEDGINMPYAEQEEHVAEWKTETSYYIRCKDRYGNQPVSNQCSMTIRPYDVLK